MKTFFTVALGVFVGLSLFAVAGYFFYSHETKKAEAEAVEILKAEQEARALLIAKNDSLLREFEDSIPKHNWQEVEEVDPITGEKTVIIGLPANSDNLLSAPILTIVCASNRTSMFVNWQDFIGSPLRTTTRLDDVVYKEVGWERSSDYTSSLYPTNPISFIKKMLIAERYVVQGRNMDGLEFTAVFDLNGIDEAIPAIRTSCDW